MLERTDEHGVVSVADQVRDAERLLRVLGMNALERRRVPILELPLEGELKIDARGDRERSSSRDEIINRNRAEVLLEERARGIAGFRSAEHHKSMSGIVPHYRATRTPFLLLSCLILAGCSVTLNIVRMRQKLPPVDMRPPQRIYSLRAKKFALRQP